MEKEINVLYIDDEVGNLKAFKAAFRRDFNIFIAESAKEGMQVLRENEIHIILTDQRMPEITGVQFLEKVIDQYPDAIRILVTGYTDMKALVAAVNKGHIFKYISKPWEVDSLRAIIVKAFEVYQLKKRQKEMNAELEKANEQLEFMLRQKLIS